VIGVLPGLVASEANPFVDLVVPTGMNYARNTILVAMADVVVAVGGGSGTLSEIALAWQHGKPIVALDLGEGWSARLAGERLDHRRDDLLHRAATPEEAVMPRRVARRKPRGQPWLLTHAHPHAPPRAGRRASRVRICRVLPDARARR
jgi:NAD kinase